MQGQDAAKCGHYSKTNHTQASSDKEFSGPSCMAHSLPSRETCTLYAYQLHQDDPARLECLDLIHRGKHDRIHVLAQI